MADKFKGLWAIAVSEDETEGDEIKGQEGAIHTVPENGFSGVELKEFNKEAAHKLLPGECFWGLARTGRKGNKPGGKTLSYMPVTAIVDPEFVPFAGLIDNLLGAEKLNARCHFKFFGLRNVDASGKGKGNQHHWFTITGTHGWIQSISYSMGAQDSFSVVMSATGWEWRTYDQKGSPKVVRSAHFDEKDELGSWKSWM